MAVERRKARPGAGAGVPRRMSPERALHSPGRTGGMEPARRLPKAAGKVYALAMAQAEQIIYDTHAAVRRLTDAGLSEGQAEAVVGEYLLLIRHNLATKDDIRGVRDEIEKLRLTTDAKLEELRLATEAKIATAKTSIILWIVGLVVGLDAMLGIAPEAIAWVAGTLFKA